MKKIKTALIIIILFVLPAASWYFLKGGLDWRKSKVEELTAKERFLYAFDFDDDDKTKLFEIMSHRTCVVKLKESISDLDRQLIDQFKKAHTFQYVSFAKSEKDAVWKKKDMERYYQPKNSTAKNKVYDSAQYMIVDTSGYIRQHYDGKDNETLTRLIEDLAVLLPREIEKDIIMKNAKKK